MEDDEDLPLVQRRRLLLGQGGNNNKINSIKNAPLSDIRNGAIRGPNTTRTNTITAPTQSKPPHFSHHQHKHSQSLSAQRHQPNQLKKKITTTTKPVPPHNKQFSFLIDSSDSDDDFVPGSFTATRIVGNLPKQPPPDHNQTQQNDTKSITTTNPTTTQRAIITNPITINKPPPVVPIPPAIPSSSSSSLPRKKLVQQALFGHKLQQPNITDSQKKQKKIITTINTTHRGFHSHKNTTKNEQQLDEEAVFANRINLDKQPMSKWSGWCRPVQPYIPPSATLSPPSSSSSPSSPSSSSLSDRKVIFTSNIMSTFSDIIIQSHTTTSNYMYESQGAAEGGKYNNRKNKNISSIGKFQGILLNIPQLSDSAGPGRITSTQLTTFLPLGDKNILSTGILCIWAKKSQLKEAFRCLAGWGFTYVENLTWVQLTPSGKIVIDNKNSSGINGGGGEQDGKDKETTCTGTEQGVACSAHTTLIMAKKQTGKETLELRHQRTCDVLLAPHLGGHRVPNEVREMLETLLPDAAVDHNKNGRGGGSGGEKKRMRIDDNGGAGGSFPSSSSAAVIHQHHHHHDEQQQQPLGLLELAFQGPDPIEVGRRGWFKIIQQQQQS